MDGRSTIAIKSKAAINSPSEIGRVKKTLQSARESRSARRKFSSIIDPRINPSSSGAGSHSSLRDPSLLRWLLWMRSAAPHVAIRTEVGLPVDLLEKLTSGVMDLPIVYAPHQRPGLRVELLIEEKLVMVTTSKRPKLPRAEEYVYVDWGPEFAAQHSLAFLELSNAPVKAGLGPLGREYLLAAGGTGYFRLDVVRSHLDAGHLRRVPDAPEFLYPAYAVYAVGADPRLISPAPVGLRAVAGPTDTA